MKVTQVQTKVNLTECQISVNLTECQTICFPSASYKGRVKVTRNARFSGRHRKLPIRMYVDMNLGGGPYLRNSTLTEPHVSYTGWKYVNQDSYNCLDNYDLIKKSNRT